jgi:hypothetical protein
MCKNNNRRSCRPRDLLLLLGYGLLQRRRRRKKKSSTQIRNKTQNPPATQPPTPPTPLRKLVKVGIIVVVVVVLTPSEPPSVCQTDTQLGWLHTILPRTTTCKDNQPQAKKKKKENQNKTKAYLLTTRIILEQKITPTPPAVLLNPRTHHTVQTPVQTREQTE